jgi:hypothetical protein
MYTFEIHYIEFSASVLNRNQLFDTKYEHVIWLLIKPRYLTLNMNTLFDIKWKSRYLTLNRNPLIYINKYCYLKVEGKLVNLL